MTQARPQPFARIVFGVEEPRHPIRARIRWALLRFRARYLSNFVADEDQARRYAAVDRELDERDRIVRRYYQTARPGWIPRRRVILEAIAEAAVFLGGLALIVWWILFS